MKKPSGWKIDGDWWVKSSRYGQRYMCPECGRKSLGIVWGDEARWMHRSECSRHPQPQTVKVDVNG